MAVYDQTDVTNLFWKQNGSIRTMHIQVGTMSRLVADEVLSLIVATLPQGALTCGYSVQGGGHVYLHY